MQPCGAWVVRQQGEDPVGVAGPVLQGAFNQRGKPFARFWSWSMPMRIKFPCQNSASPDIGPSVELCGALKVVELIEAVHVGVNACEIVPVLVGPQHLFVDVRASLSAWSQGRQCRRDSGSKAAGQNLTAPARV